MIFTKINFTCETGALPTNGVNLGPQRTNQHHSKRISGRSAPSELLASGRDWNSRKEDWYFEPEDVSRFDQAVLDCAPLR